MSVTLLAAHRRKPTADTTRKLLAALQGEATAVLRRHPAKTLPAWLSYRHLKDVIQTALARAVEQLAVVAVEYDRISDFVRGEIQSAVGNLLVPVAGDKANRKRGHVVRDGFTRQGRVEAIDGLEPEFSDYRERIAGELDRMFAAARTKTERTLVTLVATETPLAKIRRETKLRGPDVLRMLFDLKRRANQ